MRWPRSSILVLVVSFLLATWTTGSREVKNRANPRPIRVGWAFKRRIPSMNQSRPVSLSVQSPWRSKLKSVLGETDPRVFEESDLGPAPITAPGIVQERNAPSPGLRLAPLKLRC